MKESIEKTFREMGLEHVNDLIYDSSLTKCENKDNNNMKSIIDL